MCRQPCRKACSCVRLGDMIVIWPPLAISLEELDRIAAAVERGIVEATKE